MPGETGAVRCRDERPLDRHTSGVEICGFDAFFRLKGKPLRLEKLFFFSSGGKPLDQIPFQQKLRRKIYNSLSQLPLCLPIVALITAFFWLYHSGTKAQRDSRVSAASASASENEATSLQT
ncbi:hypothetical protein CHARACLAT_032824 [Characodon lateralis]|uniref:Uncharacterized protein n=1 Tax=Characodon lateralis TaxID=208331 RepID=A0ABU7F8B6_9TELE|nr:hypothetical protein [Characodon lateralis]